MYCRHIRAIKTFKLLLQCKLERTNTVLQLCNCNILQHTLKDVHSPNRQQFELFKTTGDGNLIPMVYCLCLIMECSLSTGKHNTKKDQQIIVQQRPVH